MLPSNDLIPASFKPNIPGLYQIVTALLLLTFTASIDAQRLRLPTLAYIGFELTDIPEATAAPNRLLLPPPPAFAVKCLPFFCRQEEKRDRKYIMPIRIRLGNNPYIRYMEGKGNGMLPYSRP